MYVRLDMIMLLSALLTGAALVAQNTWAILLDGQDYHKNEIPLSKLASVAKVRRPRPRDAFTELLTS